VKRWLRRWRLWLLLAAALAMTGASMLVWSLRERQHVEEAEMVRLTQQSKMIEDNLVLQFKAIHTSLGSIASDVPGWRRDNSGYIQSLHLMQVLNAAMPAVQSFLVTNANGAVILSNQRKLLGVKANAEDYVAKPRQRPLAQMLYIGDRDDDATGTRSLHFSRVILSDTLDFDGVVSAAMDIQFERILLSSLRYADDMQVTLMQQNGNVLLSERETAPATSDHLDMLFPHLKPSLDASKAPVLQWFDDLHLAVLRTIDPPDLALDKPLQILLTRQQTAVLAVWRTNVRIQVLFFIFLTVIGVIALRLFDRQRTQDIVTTKRLRLATEASGVGIWEFDLVTKKYQWDDAMFTLCGLDPKVVSPLNNDWIKLLTEQDLQRMRDATRTTIKHDQPFSLTFQIRRPDGQVRFMHNRAALYSGGDGAPRRLIGVAEDVTKRQQQEAELRIAATAFESLEAMLVTNAQIEILRVNHAFCMLFGYTSAEVVGQHPRLLKSGRHEREFYAAMWAELTQHHSWQGEVWNKRKSGEEFPCWLCITAVRDEGGVVTHYVANQTDITLRKAAEDEVKRLAFFDPLTQLPNRRLLTDRIHQALSKAKRDGGQLALIFVDLDKFKPINDRYGHAAGDQLLQAVAHRLRVCVRESDTVARVGGDEFVVLLNVVHQTSDATCVAEKIHASLRLPFDLPLGQSVQISSSIGVALYPEHGLDEAGLSQHADLAMYAAKTGGRDQYVVYAPTLDAQEHG
jgi:diguanylate cyclase (GGDEF)-like protein/PAS domain S-box-containing protein